MSATIHTFRKGYAANRHDELPFVLIPDAVYEDQHKWDESGKTFPVLLRNGTHARAKLRGDLYGLGTPGTGDPVVEVVTKSVPISK